MNNKYKIDAAIIDNAVTPQTITDYSIGNNPSFKSVRMDIAIEAMKALLAKDFKNIGFSAFNSKNSNAAEYIAQQIFILADAMIERENKKEGEDE